MKTELAKHVKGSFYKVYLDEESLSDLGHLTQYFNSSREANRWVNQIETGVFTLFVVERWNVHKLTICDSCNPPDKLIDSCGAIEAYDAEEALRLFIEQFVD